MSATVTRTPPRSAAMDRESAMRLAATEYDRFRALLTRLEPADWTRPTDCPGWDVRAMAGHTLGMTEMTASLRQFVVQNAAAARAGGGIDNLTAHQVRTRAQLRTDELVERFAAAGPRAVRGRRRLAAVIGRLPMPEKQVVGGRRETWRFDYLFTTVLTRDPWMHRVDISRATGRELQLTPEHDGRLVADVVAEWAARHGRPYRLHLTGPAGGEWSTGTGGPELELDAVEFCRVVSGRGSGTGLLAEQVPF
ncbi:maleylpyruvate isomerase family mycothiol-dependent enzyme [Geodermatophilus sp. URMC 64]